MIITLTRTGGFTGIPFKKTIDTSKLPKNQKEKIEKGINSLMQGSNITKQTELKHRDMFNYQISAEDSELDQNINLDEKSLSTKHKELINLLENC